MFWISNSETLQKFLCVLDHPSITSLIKTFEKVTGFCPLTLTSGCIEGEVWLLWVEDLLSSKPVTGSHY